MNMPNRKDLSFKLHIYNVFIYELGVSRYRKNVLRYIAIFFHCIAIYSSPPTYRPPL